MTWNYRVVKRTPPQGEVYYQIHEAYSSRNEESEMIGGLTEDAMEPYGESVDELRECLHMMLRALDKPVVDYDNACDFKME